MITIEPTDIVKTRTGIITTAGTLLPINTTRRGLIIQNLHASAPLYVCFGSGASASVFDIILKAGSATDDGLGGLMTYCRTVE